MSDSQDSKSKANLAKLTLGAIGVVYGDIGTSPLYAMRECFHGPHAIQLNSLNVLGVLSMIFWSLMLVITFKYLSLILQADNKGEGGILALTALIAPRRGGSKVFGRRAIISLGLFGAALLYADGMITPAISVMSAVEGLSVATSVFTPYVLSITILILVILFSAQRYGTGRIGFIFGPIVLVWFLTLGLLGLSQIIHKPEVLYALNPFAAIEMFASSPRASIQVMGAVFLVVTGGEALYADIGHFGAKPIRIGWYTVALPGLLLNYLGQGALLLRQPEALENPFYLMAPSWSLYPLVALATMAAVIASQAIITGAFSLTLQAIQLGYCPRLRISHTSASHKGQVYISTVNKALFVCCVLLVIIFGSSSKLAAAYGIAITLTMLITTILFYVFARRRWRWDTKVAVLVVGIFLLVDSMYLAGNIIKVFDGGWFPLLVGLLIFILMSTWQDGRKLLATRMEENFVPMQKFLTNLEVSSEKPQRVPGCAVYMVGNLRGTPQALLQNLEHNKILHKTNILLTIDTSDLPYVEPEERLEIEDLGSGFFYVVASYGFMEGPNVPQIMNLLIPTNKIPIKEDEISYFIGRETLISTSADGMARWRKRIFARMSRNAQSAIDFFCLPIDRVMEIGNQLKL